MIPVKPPAHAALSFGFRPPETPRHEVLASDGAPFYQWFEDGTLNVSYNCLDRQVAAGLGDKVAIIFGADNGTVTRTTHAQLLAPTCRMANVLRSLGVRKGDRVVIYMPMSVEGVVAMQACARLGAVHSVVFGGFSAHSLRDRIADTARPDEPAHPRLGRRAPINPAGWEWYHKHIGDGRCPIVDTWWQTETGGQMITPPPGAIALVPGSCTLPFASIMAAIVDETGGDLPNGHSGLLVIKKPWPGMIRTIWGDVGRHRSSYYPAELRG